MSIKLLIALNIIISLKTKFYNSDYDSNTSFSIFCILKKAKLALGKAGFKGPPPIAQKQKSIFFC